MLAEGAAVAALAKPLVTALGIHAGGVGPREFYETEQEWLTALLRSRMRRSG